MNYRVKAWNDHPISLSCSSVGRVVSRIWQPQVRALLGMAAVSCLILVSPSQIFAQENRPALAQKVGVIETAELSKLVLERMAELKQAQTAGKAPSYSKFILVDVRSDREMLVSVIPGAISKSEFDKNQAKYAGMVVIPYCTVGGRCGEFSRQLAQAGWTVKSYRGSIVEWVQNELPLVTLKGEPTNQLHTNGGNFKLPAKYRAIVQ